MDRKDLLIVIGALLFPILVFKACFGADPEALYRSTNPKVVLLHMVSNKKGSGGVCSGAFINEEGEVLTCAHCFTTLPDKLFVKTADGRVYRSALIRYDAKRDLALVWTGAESRPYLRLGREVKTGQRVFAFGSPLALQNTMSLGWVENKAKEGHKMIIHSAFVSPGNSGGPLVNERGQLVGVNEAILMVNFLMPAQGLFIAIDKDEVRDFLNGN